MKTIIACGALALDVKRIARRRGWDVQVLPVPALLHNRPEQIPGAVAQLREHHDVVAVAYGDCGTHGALNELPRLPGSSCYDIFGREEVTEALAEQPGTYFLTDFLARTFEYTVVREVWLAQRPTPATRRCAEAAAARLELPLEIVEVGSAGLERGLEKLLTTPAG
jgi:hypothetical protein